jgi:prevent-host-death family protein
MKTASVSHTKNHLSALLDQVRQGETVVITDHDRPVARLSAIEAMDISGGIGALERKGIVRRGKGTLCSIVKPPLPKENASAVALLLEERTLSR